MSYKVIRIEHTADGHKHEVLIGRYESSQEASERADQELRNIGYNGEIRITAEMEAESNEG